VYKIRTSSLGKKLVLIKKRVSILVEKIKIIDVSSWEIKLKGLKIFIF